MPEITPEPISAIIMAVAAFLTALGVPAIWRGVMSGKKKEPEDKMRTAIEANTVAQNAMLEQFRHNNGLFMAMGAQLQTANGHLHDIEVGQRAIHTEIVRQGK